MIKCFGYDLIRRRKNHKTYEGHLENLFKRYAINCLLDVGANRGQYGFFVRSLGFKGRIISFEPVRKTYEELLAKTSKDHRWDVYPYALGSETTSKQIRVMKNSDLSSFLMPNQRLAEMFIKNHGDQIQSKETVLVKRLDDFFFEEKLALDSSLRMMLKMDTQGYDLEVFRGAEKILPFVAVLQTEIANIPLYDGVPSFSGALYAFQGKGFELTGMFPESRNMNDFRVIEFNCLMVQQRLLTRLA
jgi:FkbM family methyltransferase